MRSSHPDITSVTSMNTSIRKCKWRENLKNSHFKSSKLFCCLSKSENFKILIAKNQEQRASNILLQESISREKQTFRVDQEAETAATNTIEEEV